MKDIIMVELEILKILIPTIQQSRDPVVVSEGLGR